MISISELRKLARARLADAEALLNAGRLDGAAYVCGYVVELTLKARICKTLKWPGYPETRSEFEKLLSFKTHDLEILLRLSGRDRYTRVKLFAEWTAFSGWTPEDRYNAVGSVSRGDVELMVGAAHTLFRKL